VFGLAPNISLEKRNISLEKGNISLKKRKTALWAIAFEARISREWQ